MAENQIILSKASASGTLRSAVADSRHFTFIFGAGASAGYSSGDISYPPPTVRDLFDSKANPAVASILAKKEHADVRRWAPYFNKERDKRNLDLESVLSELYKNDDGSDLFADILIYLQDLFYFCSSHVDENLLTNNYAQLFVWMKRNRNKNLPWTYVTFNYDTLLERSLGVTGLNKSRDFDDIGDYETEGWNPDILKVHGSINRRFEYEIVDRPGMSHREIFNLAMRQKLPYGADIVSIKPEDLIPNFNLPATRKYNQGTGTLDTAYRYNFPMIMVPIHATSRFETDEFERTLVSALKGINESHLVVAVGYNFGDNLFCEELKKINTSDKELILVGHDQLLEQKESHYSVQNLLKDKVWKGKIGIFPESGFTSFVDALTS